MPIITIFDYFKRPLVSMPLINVMHQIKTGKYDKIVRQLRTFSRKDLDAEFDAQKRLMLRFSVSGNLEMGEERLHLISYSGFLLMEIPYLSTKDLQSVKEVLMNDKHVSACFINALGNGLVFIVKTKTKEEIHKEVYCQTLLYYKQLTGVNNFGSDGGEIDHSCMVSSDEDIYINLAAVAFPKNSRVSTGSIY